MISGLEFMVGGVVFGIAVIVGIFIKARQIGKAEAEREAMVSRLEMNRDATDIERELGKLSDAEIKARMMARAKR